MVEYSIVKLIEESMDNLKTLKKDGLIAMVEELQLEVATLRAEVTILRDYVKKAKAKVHWDWRGTVESFGDNKPYSS